MKYRVVAQTVLLMMEMVFSGLVVYVKVLKKIEHDSQHNPTSVIKVTSLAVIKSSSYLLRVNCSLVCAPLWLFVTGAVCQLVYLVAQQLGHFIHLKILKVHYPLSIGTWVQVPKN